MQHVAIIKKSWGLTEKVLNGQKKIESRWYMAKHAPWDRIKEGEVVCFKDSGEPVSLKAEVERKNHHLLCGRKLRSIVKFSRIKHEYKK